MNGAAAGNPPVVAAIDGSETAAGAALWAAEEASRRHAPLHLFAAYGYEETELGSKASPPSEWLRAKAAMAEDLLRETRHLVEAAVPGLAVTTEASGRGPVPGLLAVSGQARVLVTGEPAGAIAGLFSGSPAIDLAARAHCPVVVVRGTGTAAQRAPVVVGVDGSPLSDAAVVWAFEEASLRNVPLVAVHVWYDRDPEWLYPAELGPPMAPVAEVEQRVLAERLAGWAERYPEVEVERVVEQDMPRRRLLERSKDAQLVVVGSRGRGGFAGLVLGSTSQALLHHAECPVMVVRTEIHRSGADREE